MSDDLEELAAAASSAPTRRIPEYRGIKNGAALIKSYAGSWRALAVIAWIIAAILTIITGAVFLKSQTESGGFPVLDYLILVVIADVILIVAGIMFWRWAALHDLVAELALAQRDIAVNSFKMLDK